MRSYHFRISRTRISGRKQNLLIQRFKDKNDFEISDEIGNVKQFEDSQVKVEQIMDQKDIVDERQQNIREISDMMTKVNQISKEMNQLIHKQDEDLDNIHKKQENIQNNAQTTVKDMVEVDNITKKKLKKIAFWAIGIILLALCIIGLIYILKGKKKSDDPKTQPLQLGNSSIHNHYRYDPIEHHLSLINDHQSANHPHPVNILIITTSLI